MTVAEGAFNLPSEKPRKSSEWHKAALAGGFFLPKDLGKLPLPKATHDSNSKAMEGKKANLDVSVLLSKWRLQKFNW